MRPRVGGGCAPPPPVAAPFAGSLPTPRGEPRYGVDCAPSRGDPPLEVRAENVSQVPYGWRGYWRGGWIGAWQCGASLGAAADNWGYRAILVDQGEAVEFVEVFRRQCYV